MADEEKAPKKVTDIDALADNVQQAVMAFNEQWVPMPKFDIGVEIMNVSQLRDAMGLRASIDWGDPWPAAEKALLDFGFRWHTLGGERVMFLRERDGFVPDDGWQDGEVIEE